MKSDEMRSKVWFPEFEKKRRNAAVIIMMTTPKDL